MDLNAIKNKLQNMQQKPKGAKVDYDKIFWKPPVGKTQIRVVPSKFDKTNPFKELFFHYGITNKVMVSPTSFGEKDPIVEFARQLRQSSDKENWRLAKKLDPKMRIFVPVIVRGEEDKGVRLWQFGKEMYMEFLSMADDDDIGDFTDIMEGRDFTVDTVGPEVTGTAYNKSSIRPRTKITSLSDDPSQVTKWLEDQPDSSTLFKRYTFEEMKEALEKWLSPEEEGETYNEGDIIDEDEKENESQTSYALNVAELAKKVSKTDKFDALFEEEND
jgi:hypothetical protein